MKALTVQQPWAWAIVHGGKDVENRTQLWRYRGPLAIHAGGRVSERGERVVPSIMAAERRTSTTLCGDAMREGQVLSAVIGIVDLVDVHEQHDGCCESWWAETTYVEHGGLERAIHRGFIRGLDKRQQRRHRRHCPQCNPNHQPKPTVARKPSKRHR